MSQQTNCGFKAPGFSVRSEEPLCAAPCTCRGNWSILDRVEPSGLVPSVAIPGVSFQSLEEGVAHKAARIAEVNVSAAIEPSFLLWPPVCSLSSARGVGHIAIAATVAKLKPVALRSTLAKSGPAAAAFGVGQRAIAWGFNSLAKPPNNNSPFLAPLRLLCPPSALATLGVGHKPKSISSMGRVDGTSWQYCCPEGVTLGFQVNTHSVEPILSNRCRNLFSKDNWRLEGGNKRVPYWPEVALVGLAFLLAGNGVRLTGAASSPNRSGCGPSRKLEGERPSADSGEEVALDEPFEVSRFNLGD